MSLSKSIADFFGNLTKEPAEEAGGVIADHIRFFRIKRAVLLKEKLEGFLRERGVTDRRQIPLKLAVEILDGATMEDDDELHTTWAKLLRNAVDPAFKPEVRVAYADILRSLNALDVRLLDEIYVAAQRPRQPITKVDVHLVQIANRIHVNQQDTELSRDCLIRQRCIVQAPKMVQQGQHITHNEDGASMWVTPPPLQIGVEEHVVFLTPLGAAFTECCRLPENAPASTTQAT